MKIVRLNALRSPNVFSYKPVLRIRLDLEAQADMPSAAVHGFTENLLHALPGLKAHKCALGYPGGFVERLVEGTYPAHIFEHVLLELQSLCGDDVKYGKARATDEPGVYDVIAAYRTEALAKRCAYLAERLLNALFTQQPVEIGAEIAELKALRQALQPGPSAAAVLAAAQRRGIPAAHFVEGDLLVLGQGKHMRRVWSTVTDRTSLLATDLVANKHMTAQLLEEYGVPVPRGGIARSEEEAVSLYRALGGSVVVKPLAGSHGRGVTVDLASEAEVRKAFHAAAVYGACVRVETHVSGRQYRFCMVGHKLAAAAERIPAYVIGDGQHTVAELVRLANENPLRGEGHDKPLTRITLDEAALAVLAKQDLSPHIVPEVKRVVQIKETANISTGGTAVDVTAIVHPENILLAEHISRIVGLDVAGLDIIASDITKPLAGSGAVIEVNAAPGIRMHHHPAAGQPRDVGAKIVEHLFPPGSDGRIPVVAVTGTNGKTTVTRLIARAFRQAGYAVGMSTTEGIYLNERCLMRGDCSGPVSARTVLAHPEAEAAVLETARGGIVRAGLGFSRCDVGVVTNVSEDHLGQDGIEDLEDLAHVKSLVLEVVDVTGTAVINADDRFAPAFSARVQAQIVYFSAKPDNIVVRRHLGAGGRAVFLRGGKVCFAAGARCEEVLSIDQVPLTFGGKAAHNVENVLAAAAACLGYGIGPAQVKAAFENFSHNAGRLHLMAVGDFRVCVDYGHNAAGFRAVIRTARQMGAHRVVGVIAAPGDRRDEAIEALGGIAGRGFDRLYIKEDADLRGRAPGEAAALLKRGALAAGFSEALVCVVPDEGEAVARALTEAEADDLVVVFYERYDAVMAQLETWRQKLTEAAQGTLVSQHLPRQPQEEHARVL